MTTLTGQNNIARAYDSELLIIYGSLKTETSPANSGIRPGTTVSSTTYIRPPTEWRKRFMKRNNLCRHLGFFGARGKPPLTATRSLRKHTLTEVKHGSRVWSTINHRYFTGEYSPARNYREIIFSYVGNVGLTAD